MAKLTLELARLIGNGQTAIPVYDLLQLKQDRWTWDRVVKSTHPINCWYGAVCNFNLYVKDGVVLREEQAGNYPEPNDPRVPDFNPRGCQKGTCYSHRMYDPTRIKYPMKRIGERGGGKWQRLTWDEALTEIADVLIDTLVTEGPEVIIDGGGTQSQIGISEGMAITAFTSALGTPMSTITADNGDDHQGAAITFGKVIVADSADDWFHANIILVWGGNPVYTNMPNYHYIAEARYNGAKIIGISPDYNPSAIHVDRWVPVNIGSDAALALSMCQVILEERLFNAEFVKEQTDMPLLVIEGTRKLLREQDLKRGGRDDTFYVYDLASGAVVEAPRKTLALGSAVPALEGTFQVQTLQGKVAVKPVMQLLREHLDHSYTPEQANPITGVPAKHIQELAREIATAGGVVNISSANWGKYYHGDLMERAIILVFALCGHMGRKGACFSAFPMLGLDTALGGLQKRGDDILLAAAGSDPRYAGWREDGFTDEMILYEYSHQAFEQGALTPTSLMYLVHGGYLELSEQHAGWDPYLKRPIRSYLQEAFDKKWQTPAPPIGKEPRVLFSVGGNFMRRARGTNLLLQNFLPKLRLIVSIDFRWNATAAYADIVLPVCSWYERTSTHVLGQPMAPFAHVLSQATPPLYDSKSEWETYVLLGRKVEERARQRGITSFRDMKGIERRFAGLEEKVTCGGLYADDDEEGVARDMFVNSTNVEQLDWEEVKDRGFVRYTSVGNSMRSMGNACEIVPGDPLVPLTWHTEKKQPYPTLTRRIQFFLDHELFEELGEDLPVHKAPPKVGGEYPLQVTGGHARWSVHTMWVDNALMLQLQRGEPAMFISAEDARARGIADGDAVEVFNDIASFRVQVAVSPAVRPGQVIVYHAWENYQFDGWRHFKSVMGSPMNPVELAGGYFHIRPITMANYPGFSDRAARVEVRKEG